MSVFNFGRNFFFVFVAVSVPVFFFFFLPQKDNERGALAQECITADQCPGGTCTNGPSYCCGNSVCYDRTCTYYVCQLGFCTIQSQTTTIIQTNCPYFCSGGACQMAQCFINEDCNGCTTSSNYCCGNNVCNRTTCTTGAFCTNFQCRGGSTTITENTVRECTNGCSGGACLAASPPTVDLKIDGQDSFGSCIGSGLPHTISWSSSNATSCSGSMTANICAGNPCGGWSGPKPLSGSINLNPPDTIRNDGTFTLTCSGPGGTRSDSVYVGICDPDNCSDECNPSGSTRCFDPNTRQTCGNYDVDRCTEWGNNTLCGLDVCSTVEPCRWVDSFCSAGACSSSIAIDTSCTGLCPSGQCNPDGTCVGGLWPPPTNLTSQSPLNYCTAPLSVRLGWTLGNPALQQAAYEVQICSDSSCSNVLPAPPSSGKVCNGNQEYAISSGLNYNTTYWWRVRVWNTGADGVSCNQDDSVSNWSSVASFTTVAHRPPEPNFYTTPPFVRAGQEIQFNNTSKCYTVSAPTTPYDCITGSNSYFWDFDDGTTSLLPQPTHEYSLAGTYAVDLTVTDDMGSCTLRDKMVSVSPLPFWKEVAPFSWIINAFLALKNVLFQI